MWVNAGIGWDQTCVQRLSRYDDHICTWSRLQYIQSSLGSWGGYESSGILASLPPNDLNSEQAAFWISNGLQVIYSFLYLLLIYNASLICMERDWARYETQRHKLRCTLVKGPAFEQSYFFQLPKWIIIPLMGFSSLMHWMLSQAISTRELIWSDVKGGVEVSQYEVMAR